MSDQPINPVITLTTDFGTADGYVGTLKGVIYALNPAARVIDLSHEVAPQRIAEAAFVLYRAYRFFPAHTIHVAVVDPGVGSERKCVLLDTAHGRFIAPDNGLLTYVYQAEQQILADPAHEAPFAVSPFADLPPNAPHPPVYEISNPAYRLHTLSRTFHGRDVFAPAAAHLSLGVAAAEFGPRIAGLTLLPNAAPRHEANRIIGHVLHIDRFGNLITNIDDALMTQLHPDRAMLRAAVGRDNICPLFNTYADADEGALLALVGSERMLEIAVRNGSAARRLGARVGDPVVVMVAG